jgi:hypothetical protein
VLQKNHENWLSSLDIWNSIWVMKLNNDDIELELRLLLNNFFLQ